MLALSRLLLTVLWVLPMVRMLVSSGRSLSSLSMTIVCSCLVSREAVDSFVSEMVDGHTRRPLTAFWNQVCGIGYCSVRC